MYFSSDLEHYEGFDEQKTAETGNRVVTAITAFWLVVAQLGLVEGSDHSRRLDASIGALLAQFGPLRGVLWAENS